MSAPYGEDPDPRKPGLSRTPSELAELVGTWIGFACVAFVAGAALLVAGVHLLRWLF